jgi:hypothetical protein
MGCGRISAVQNRLWLPRVRRVLPKASIGVVHENIIHRLKKILPMDIAKHRLKRRRAISDI